MHTFGTTHGREQQSLQKNKNILITGHRGFVGRHFWKRLENDHYLTGVDIVDGLDARQFFKANDTHFDLVIHLAAVVGGRATIEGAPLSVAVDLAIDAEMWQWALRTRPGRVVYYSSSAAYPVSLQARECHWRLEEQMINLDDIQSPDLTYGWAKLTGEYQAKFVQAEGVKVNVFRPFSGYGEDQSLDYPFPSFIERGVNRANPFEIWGDGKQTRDFIHIDDVVEGTLAAADQDYPEPLNLGTGRATSFNDLAHLVTRACNYYPEISHLPAKPTGVDWRVANIDNMYNVYKPKVTLEEGIQRSIDWRTK